MSRPTALVVQAPGTNRDGDVSFALDLAGAEPRVALLGELLQAPSLLDDAQMLVLPGGFSHADSLGAGRMVGLELTLGLGDLLHEFVAAGKPVIGICNGFQALVRTGLLPGGGRSVALGHNVGGSFQCRWVTLTPVSQRCVWTRDLTEGIECPIAHGEGRFTCAPDVLAALQADDLVALRYSGTNPNGSLDDIAGITDPSGVVLGLMPHPENHVVRNSIPATTAATRQVWGCACSRAASEPRGVVTMTDTAALISPFVECTLPLTDRREGKVRVSYVLPPSDGVARRLFVTTDRLSAFDRVLAGVPYKGQVLNQLAAHWFATTEHIVANHVLAVPDPNVTIGVAAEPLPVEVVVRGHITGVTSTSLWRQYADGARTIYGYDMPDGLRKNTELPQAIVTPTTKGELAGVSAGAGGGHDLPISCADVVSLGLVDAALWDEVQDIALALFAHGKAVAAAAGLILADTKFEFGVDADGRLLLIDEALTPDSSRYWEADSYADRLAAGDEPESLDKEPVRRALDAIGYGGDGDPPPLPGSVWTDTTARYITAYERLTGSRFETGDYPVEPRILNALDRENLL